jgi:hypothetical protein
VGLAGLAACGDDAATTPDAPRPPDAPIPPDAAVDLYALDEGGEVRIEYQEIFNPMGTIRRSRATAFVWKSKTPAKYPFVNIPGCTKMEMDNFYPLGMGDTHEYQDVGQVIITGGAEQVTLPLGPNPGLDGIFRPHDGHWRFFVDQSANSLNFFGAFDAKYTTIFTGSPTWPAQVFEDASYMPSAWTLGTPGFGPVPLVADQDLVITYDTPPQTNQPPGTTNNMIVALLVPPMGLVVECVEESENGVFDGSITVPAEFVNHARAFAANGVMARAHVSHILHELEDGTGNPTGKRIDFFTIWCFVTPWVAQ